MEFTNNCVFINRMLLTEGFDELHRQEPFLVHATICQIVQKYLTRSGSGVDVLQHLGSYGLTVGAYKFDMEMLFLRTQSTPPSFNVFKNLLKISQFTYFWENRITLFREVERYYELEEFIAINNLKKHVISVEVISGVNSIGQPIKLVTFDGTSDQIERDELLVNYENFLQTKSLSATDYGQTCHYYFMRTLPWHSSVMFRMYRRLFRNQRIFLELQTFLTCMRELTYEREPHLDLISLCSLKLAFCDDLNLTDASCDLEFEIDALIERFLRRMVQNQTYIKNGEFDLYRYGVDINSQMFTSDPSVHNLIYTFQHIFHSINLMGCTGYGLLFGQLTQTLMLIDDSTDLKVLTDRSKITHKVDAQNYNKMNSKLFCELLKCRNVDKIVLDTNYRWANESYLTDFVNRGRNVVTILLVGTNEFNFIEDFMQFLKTVPTSVTSSIKLEILGDTLRCYNIFKNFKVRNLQFRSSKITFTMLTELLECKLKNLSISFYNCTIEDKTSTWSLLIKRFDRQNVRVEILEEEKTWQYLFESIANHLTKFKLNKIRFKFNLEMICENYIGKVSVIGLYFTIDEFNTRLELQNESGQAIDLYRWKNALDWKRLYTNTVFKSEEDYEHFEFYQ